MLERAQHVKEQLRLPNGVSQPSSKERPEARAPQTASTAHSPHASSALLAQLVAN